MNSLPAGGRATLTPEIVEGEILWVDDVLETEKNPPLDPADPAFYHVKEPDGWYTARLKWDGCVEVARYFNYPAPEIEDDRQDIDSIHICSIDDFIKRLEGLKVVGREKFGEDWGK